MSVSFWHSLEVFGAAAIPSAIRGTCSVAGASLPGPGLTQLRLLPIDYCALHGAGLCAILYEDRRALSLARAPKSKVMTLF